MVCRCEFHAEQVHTVKHWFIMKCVSSPRAANIALPLCITLLCFILGLLVAPHSEKCGDCERTRPGAWFINYRMTLNSKQDNLPTCTVITCDFFFASSAFHLTCCTGSAVTWKNARQEVRDEEARQRIRNWLKTKSGMSIRSDTTGKIPANKTDCKGWGTNTRTNKRGDKGDENETVTGKWWSGGKIESKDWESYVMRNTTRPEVPNREARQRSEKGTKRRESKTQTTTRLRKQWRGRIKMCLLD